VALVVEDGTGIATANSYVTLAEVATYHTDRNNTSWGSASTASQTAAVIDATRYLDTEFSWDGGMRVSSTQALLWPRKMMYDMEGFALSGIPTVLKNAACELALVVLTEDILAAQDRETKSETVGPISVVYTAGASPRKKYPFIRRLLERNGLIAASGILTIERS
jgi:hypothetical protein